MKLRELQMTVQNLSDTLADAIEEQDVADDTLNKYRVALSERNAENDRLRTDLAAMLAVCRAARRWYETLGETDEETAATNALVDAVDDIPPSVKEMMDGD